MPLSSGQRLLRFDRRLGARFVAGVDEAGRGSLAGPLVVAGVLLDYECLRDHRVRPLALLNDSKQLSHDERQELFRAVVGCATRIAVRMYSARTRHAIRTRSVTGYIPAPRSEGRHTDPLCSRRRGSRSR